MRLSRVKGTRDILGLSAQVTKRVIQTGSGVLSKAGYLPIFLPSLEHEELFRHPLGTGSDIVLKEMFHVQDPSGHEIVLRPEGTVGCMRAYIQGCPGDPVKWTYAGPMFRRERPQQGRYREFYQLGAEVIGLPSLPSVDVELIQLAWTILSVLGIKTELHINTLGLSSERNIYIERLKKYCEQHIDQLSVMSKERLVRNPLRILDSKEPEDQVLLESAPKLINHLESASLHFFQDVKSGLESAGIPFIEDFLLVRGLDYYNHTCFEFLHEGKAVLAGGRYDSLSSILGCDKDFPATGFAAGVDRIAELLPESEEKRLVIGVVSIGKENDQYCTQLVSKLKLKTKENCSIHFVSGEMSVGKATKLMHKLKAGQVIFIGEDERRTGTWKVKDMKSGEQTVEEETSLEGLIQRWEK